MPSAHYTADDSLNRLWELKLLWWRVIRLRRLVFLISWRTIGKQMVVHHSELTVLPSSSEKTGDHLLGCASCASNFCWIWLILKHPYNRLLFTFGLMSVNPKFRSYAIVFLEHFLQTTRTNFFDGQMFMQYWMYAGPTHAQSCLMMILEYQLAHSINGFGNNNWFWKTFTKFVLKWTTTSVQFTIPSINTGPWASSPKI